MASMVEFPQVGYVREPQVLQVFPVGRSTLWSMCRQGRFPKPVKLSARVTAWRASEVLDWLDRQGK